tara:strand:- start:75 stop:539 length:465 start_codon:yes stop_codon:yes gene_type:complete
VPQEALSNNERIEAVKGVLASIFASQRTLKTIAPEYKWAGLGNLLGDFGELLATNHYQLEKAPAGSSGFDARTKEGKTVQIKTNYAASMIGYRGEADLMLVIHIEENGDWSEVYFGDQGIVKDNSNYSKRDNKYVIQVTKLKSLQAQRNQKKID